MAGSLFDGDAAAGLGAVLAQQGLSVESLGGGDAGLVARVAVGRFPEELFRVDGDPQAVMQFARSWSGFGEQAGAAADRIRRFDTSNFVGGEGELFRDRVPGQLGTHLAATGLAYADVGEALVGYAGDLTSAMEVMGPVAVSARGVFTEMQVALSQIPIPVVGVEALARFVRLRGQWEQLVVQAEGVHAGVRQAAQWCAERIEHAGDRQYRQSLYESGLAGGLVGGRARSGARARLSGGVGPGVGAQVSMQERALALHRQVAGHAGVGAAAGGVSGVSPAAGSQVSAVDPGAGAVGVMAGRLGGAPSTQEWTHITHVHAGGGGQTVVHVGGDDPVSAVLADRGVVSLARHGGVGNAVGQSLLLLSNPAKFVERPPRKRRGKDALLAAPTSRISGAGKAPAGVDKSTGVDKSVAVDDRRWGVDVQAVDHYETATVPHPGGGHRTFMLLNNERAPHSYVFTVEHGVDERLVTEPDGSLARVDRSGAVTGRVEAPWAKDALGRQVRTYYVVDNHGDGTSTVTQKIVPGQGVLYPILADPTDSKVSDQDAGHAVAAAQGLTAAAAKAQAPNKELAGQVAAAQQSLAPKQADKQAADKELAAAQQAAADQRAATGHAQHAAADAAAKVDGKKHQVSEAAARERSASEALAKSEHASAAATGHALAVLADKQRSDKQLAATTSELESTTKQITSEQAKAAKAASDITSAENAEKAASSSAEAAEASAASAQSKADAANRDLPGARSQLAGAQQTLRGAHSAVAAAGEQLRNAGANPVAQRQAREALAAANEQVRQANAVVSSAAARVTGLEKTAAEQAKRAEQFRVQAQRLHAEARRQHALVEAARKARAEAEAAVRRLTDKAQQLRSQQERLRAEVAAKTEQLAQARRVEAQARSQVIVDQRAVERAHAQVARLEAEVLVLQLHKNTADARLADQVARQRQVDQRVSVASSRVGELVKSIAGDQRRIRELGNKMAANAAVARVLRERAAAVRGAVDPAALARADKAAAVKAAAAKAAAEKAAVEKAAAQKAAADQHGGGVWGWAKKAASQTKNFYAGMGRSLADTWDGIKVAVEHPGLAAQGLKTLVGLGGPGAPGVADTWKMLGSAFIAKDDFAHGDVAYALGKALGNVLQVVLDPTHGASKVVTTAGRVAGLSVKAAELSGKAGVVAAKAGEVAKASQVGQVAAKAGAVVKASPVGQVVGSGTGSAARMIDQLKAAPQRVWQGAPSPIRGAASAASAPAAKAGAVVNKAWNGPSRAFDRAVDRVGDKIAPAVGGHTKDDVVAARGERGMARERARVTPRTAADKDFGVHQQLLKQSLAAAARDETGLAGESFTFGHTVAEGGTVVQVQVPMTGYRAVPGGAPEVLGVTGRGRAREVRIDQLSITREGVAQLRDAKTGMYAGPTVNQRAMYPAINTHGVDLAGVGDETKIPLSAFKPDTQEKLLQKIRNETLDTGVPVRVVQDRWVREKVPALGVLPGARGFLRDPKFPHMNAGGVPGAAYKAVAGAERALDRWEQAVAEFLLGQARQKVYAPGVNVPFTQVLATLLGQQQQRR